MRKRLSDKGEATRRLRDSVKREREMREAQTLEDKT